MKKVYQEIASRLIAIENCRKANNQEWLEKHSEVIEQIVNDEMPSGSGVDRGTKFDWYSSPDRLVFHVDYHHMNDGGMYDGWTQHRVIVKPSLAFGFDLTITGKDRNQIKEYIADVYGMALNQEYKPEPVLPTLQKPV